MHHIIGIVLAALLMTGCAPKQEKLANIFTIAEFQQLDSQKLQFKVTLQDTASLSAINNSVRILHANGVERKEIEFPLVIVKKERFEPEYAWMAFMQGGFDYFLVMSPETMPAFNALKSQLAGKKGVVKIELIENVTAEGNVDAKACHATYIQTGDSGEFSPLSAYEVLKL